MFTFLADDPSESTDNDDDVLPVCVDNTTSQSCRLNELVPETGVDTLKEGDLPDFDGINVTSDIITVVNCAPSEGISESIVVKSENITVKQATPNLMQWKVTEETLKDVKVNISTLKTSSNSTSTNGEFDNTDSKTPYVEQRSYHNNNDDTSCSRPSQHGVKSDFKNVFQINFLKGNSDDNISKNVKNNRKIVVENENDPNSSNTKKENVSRKDNDNDSELSQHLYYKNGKVKSKSANDQSKDNDVKVKRSECNKQPELSSRMQKSTIKKKKKDKRSLQQSSSGYNNKDIAAVEHFDEKPAEPNWCKQNGDTNSQSAPEKSVKKV